MLQEYTRTIAPGFKLPHSGRTGYPLGPSARDPWSRPWPAVFSATRGVILGRRAPEAPILKTCLLGLLIACLCASAADLPKLPPETMGLDRKSTRLNSSH